MLWLCPKVSFLWWKITNLRWDRQLRGGYKGLGTAFCQMLVCQTVMKSSNCNFHSWLLCIGPIAWHMCNFHCQRSRSNSFNFIWIFGFYFYFFVVLVPSAGIWRGILEIRGSGIPRPKIHLCCRRLIWRKLGWPSLGYFNCLSACPVSHSSYSSHNLEGPLTNQIQSHYFGVAEVVYDNLELLDDISAINSNPFIVVSNHFLSRIFQLAYLLYTSNFDSL